jgi:hypothetical protein
VNGERAKTDPIEPALPLGSGALRFTFHRSMVAVILFNLIDFAISLHMFFLLS